MPTPTVVALGARPAVGWQLPISILADFDLGKPGHPSNTSVDHIGRSHRWPNGHRARARQINKGRYPNHAVLPIVLYLRGGPKGQAVLQWVEETAGFEVCRFRCLALGLSGDQAERHIEAENPLGWALAALMGSERLDNVERKLACLRRIARAPVDEARKFLLFNIVETYLELTQDEHQRYKLKLDDEKDDEVHTMQLTWEERHYYRGWDEGLDMGRQEGRQEGLEEGELEGIRKTLRHQIEYRLGALTEAQRKRLDTIRDAEALEELAKRLLDARSLADLGFDRE